MSTTEQPPGSGWLLALHSSSEVLGVALQPLGLPDAPAKIQAFPMGRELANTLLPCVESILPATEWIRLARLAVAIGPGGFTGTRLTVAMARTLAQQLGLPLDGISSFHLIARRLLRDGGAPSPLILRHELPRHGLVAGLYGVDPPSPGGVVELSPPRLFHHDNALASTLGDHPRLLAEPRIPADVEHLLAFSQEMARRGVPSPWVSVVPLYPTSPVEIP